MTIKLGEIGKRIVFSASFDMSANTSINATLTKPDGSTLVVAATLGTTVLGTLAANEWAYYDTQSGDIDATGTWRAYIQYDDATPKTLFSDEADFKVLPVTG